MKIMKLLSNTMAKLLVVLALTFGFVSQSIADAVDIEPNDSCPGAQDVGAITTPFIVTGSLDTPPAVPDVDFFRFSAAPGAQLVSDLEGQSTGKGTLPDPFLGLFDSACNLLDLNDDSGSLNSRLSFEVPADGIFVLAASSCCDPEFTGNGGSSGTYQLIISAPPPSIGSISGRVVDAVTGQPLPGDSPPFAFVELLRCDVGGCFEFVNFQNATSEGRFLFERDFSNQLLPVGTYQVRANANEYQAGETDPFEVGEGEDRDVGDIPLVPPPIVFSDIQPCDALLPQGGTCHYSAKINNNTGAPLKGTAWSLVDGFGLGSNLGFTNFEASTKKGVKMVHRQKVSTQPLSSTVVRFRFDVPSFTQNGATFCTRLFFGLDPDPLVNTAREGHLFCITKGDIGFRVMSEGESQQIFQSTSRRLQMLRNAPAQKQ